MIPRSIVRLIVVGLLLAFLALGAQHGVAEEDGKKKVVLPAGSRLIRLEGRVENWGPGLPSVVQIRVNPPDAAGGGELLVSIYKDEALFRRRVLPPVAPGVYNFQYTFPEGGLWHLYMRFGPGQAGFVGTAIVDVTQEAGTVGTFSGVFRTALAGAPGYVLPLGYATFGLIATLALAAVAATLIWLRRQPLGPPMGRAPRRATTGSR